MKSQSNNVQIYKNIYINPTNMGKQKEFKHTAVKGQNNRQHI